YLLMALSEQTGAKNTPSELDGVLKQLRNVFTYQGFRLLDTLVVRSRNGMEGGINGIAPKNPEEAQPTFYRFNFGSASITSDSNTGRMIRVDNLRLGATVPVKTISETGSAQFKSAETGINTNIDVREGQKIVVGKATIDGSNNALFLVLTAKVLDCPAHPPGNDFPSPTFFCLPAKKFTRRSSCVSAPEAIPEGH